MAQRNLAARPEAVCIVVIPYYSEYLGKMTENVYGPYTEAGAKSALKSEKRYHPEARIERAETTWAPIAEAAAS